MKILLNNSVHVKELFNLKNDEWVANQREAGKIASFAISTLQKYVENKTDLSLLKLNNIAEEIIYDSKGIPTFKNYKGFPCGVCISVNKEIVHGIPKDISLNDGDVVSFDLGVTINGAIADTATTVIFGEPKSKLHEKLLQVTADSLYKAIESIRLDKKLGIIGATIYKIGRQNDFGVISQYGGHHIDLNKPHAPPFVSNKDNENNGIRFQVGQTLAIEPMFTIGDTETKVSSDKWTVLTNDIGAHFEHTIFIHQNGVEIMTYRQNESYFKNNFIEW